MKCSVVIPTYNSRKFIERCLESVYLNTSCTGFDDFEIIVVDDGSTDKTVSFLQKAGYPRLRVYKLDKHYNTWVNARNYGNKKAVGDYIVELDSDDMMTNDRLIIQCDYLDRHKDVTLVCGDWFLGSKPIKPTPNFSKQRLLTCNPICHSSVAYRKKAFFDAGGYNDKIICCGDYDMWLRLVFKGFKIAKINHFCCIWKGHANQMSRTRNAEQQEWVRKIQQHWRNKK